MYDPLPRNRKLMILELRRRIARDRGRREHYGDDRISFGDPGANNPQAQAAAKRAYEDRQSRHVVYPPPGGWTD